MWRSTQRGYWFLRAYFRFLGIHSTLQSRGFNGARNRYLKPWKDRNHRQLHQSRLIDDIDWAIQKARAWQLKKTECLQTALCAYSLLREASAQPYFVMAVQSHPYSAHAWVHVMDTVIADTTMDDMRGYYTRIMQIPKDTSSQASKRYPAPGSIAVQKISACQ